MEEKLFELNARVDEAYDNWAAATTRAETDPNDQEAAKAYTATAIELYRATANIVCAMYPTSDKVGLLKSINSYLVEGT